jgi:hypothetical protein
MTTTTPNDLQISYTLEERDKMIEDYADALRRGEHKEALRIVRTIPLNAGWAKSIATVMGREYLEKNFNITRATEELGEGWLDGF